MSTIDRIPSLKHIIIWLAVISVICFVIGGMITIIDGGRYSSHVRESIIPVSILPLDAQDAQVSLELGSGTINLTAGNATALVSGLIKSSNSRCGLVQSYAVVNGTGMLILAQESTGFFDPLEKEQNWDLLLDPDIPTALRIETGATNISLDTGRASLTSLNVEVGTGDLLIDLSGWNGVHLPVTIEEGIGSLTILLPESATIGADIEDGLGSRTITGLEGGDGHYFLASSLPGAPVLSLTIHQGVGDLTMKTVPENSP